jgi:hypothetical protein
LQTVVADANERITGPQDPDRDQRHAWASALAVQEMGEDERAGHADGHPLPGNLGRKILDG